MKSRALIIAISIILAAIATLGVGFYIAKLKAEIVEGKTLVDVLVIKKPVKAGTSINEAYAIGALVKQKIPKEYVIDGALKSTHGYTDRSFSTDMSAGEQITESKLNHVDDSSLSYMIPEGLIAVSVAVDEVTGVGGKIKAGDIVDVIATINMGTSNSEKTKILLQGVKVLMTSDSEVNGKSNNFVKNQPSSISKKTITLAIIPAYAEKLVFAAETGHLWICLRHNNDSKFYKTTGQSLETVFK